MKPSTPLLLTTAIGLTLIALGGKSTAVPADAKPTIVLVHGAFADSTSWFKQRHDRHPIVQRV